jgi:hypothetical protein
MRPASEGEGIAAECVRYQPGRWISDKIIGCAIRFEERVDFSPQLLVAAARTGEEGVALAGRQLARGVKDLFEFLQRR